MLASVNATRMELLRLRRRVSLASRGHRLLSEKRDEISRQLIKIAREIRPLREKVEKELSETFRRFMLARATMEPEHTKAALAVPTKKFSLAIDFANVMNIKVPHLTKDISGEIICYSYATKFSAPSTCFRRYRHVVVYINKEVIKVIIEEHRLEETTVGCLYTASTYPSLVIFSIGLIDCLPIPSPTAII